MGAINYGTSKYVTLGINPSCYEENDDKYCIIDELFERAKAIVNNYIVIDYKISIEPGYYEGFYLNIEDYFDWCLDSFKERREINRQITSIKNMMKELVNIGLVSVYPGWCTGYSDEKRTKLDINKAVRYMREEVKKIPTYSQYLRKEKN